MTMLPVPEPTAWTALTAKLAATDVVGKGTGTPVGRVRVGRTMPEGRLMLGRVMVAMPGIVRVNCGTGIALTTLLGGD